jgi:hypothetical protein
MDILFEDGVAWTEVFPPGGETWYMTTVFYEFKFDMEPDHTYISVPGARARFTVRNAGTEDAPLWKLVEMRDLGADGLFSTVASGGTEATTWGAIKAVYR